MGKRRRRQKQLALPLPSPRDEAQFAAEDIRRWTDGPNPAPMRIERLAQALRHA